MRIREGVSASVNAKMEAVQANVLREDGALFRTCAHGVRHPVGNIHTGYVTTEDVRIHDVLQQCCPHQCCQQWLAESAA